MTDENVDAPANAVAHDEGHGHAEETLGPIDWGIWGYAIVGGLGGLVVLVFFVMAVGGALG